MHVSNGNKDCHSRDTMWSKAFAGRLLVQSVVLSLLVSAALWTLVWALSFAVWSSPPRNPALEFLPLWMRIPIASQKWFFHLLPYLLGVAVVARLAHMVVTAPRGGVPLCLTAAAIGEHTVTVWERPFIQVVWFDGREVSRKLNPFDLVRHRFFVAGSSAEREDYDVKLSSLPYYRLTVTRSDGIMVKSRNLAGTLRALLFLIPGTIGICLLGIFATTRLPEGSPLEHLVFAATCIAGAYVLALACRAIDRRAIDAYFEGQDSMAGTHARSRRWEWLAVPAALLVAWSLWGYPSRSALEHACDEGYASSCAMLTAGQ